MRLVKFKVSGFRSLREISWIPINKLTVFTGQNDGGKTSLLEALTIFLNPKREPEPADYSSDASGNTVTTITMEGAFQLNEDEISRLSTQKQTLTIKRSYSPTERIGYSYEARVHPDSRLQQDLSATRNDELLALAEGYHVQLSNRRQKESIVRELSAWLQTQELTDGWQILAETMTKGFPQLKVFQSADALDPESQLNATLRESFVTRIKTESYSGTLNSLTNQIEREMQTDIEEFVPILRQYCPDIISIDIRPSFDFSNGFKTSKLLLRKDSGALVDLNKEGQGRRRHVTLAVYEWTEKLLSREPDERSYEQTIVAFDEPDTHLDYAHQRKIFDIIKRISSNPETNVIVCTHSLNLIDRIPITDLVHFHLVQGCTKINTVTTDDQELTDIFLYQISETMGLRNSAMLNERCFLVVEGPTEIYSLPVLFALRFGYSPQVAGITILNGENGIGARLFAKFLNSHKRNVIFLVDTDTTSSPHQRYFTRENLASDGIDIERQVFFVGTMEFEDSFSDETYLRAAQSYWRKSDGTQWELSEFRGLRSEPNFCDALMALVRRTTQSNITKPQVGLHLAKSITRPEDIPAQIERCLSRANDLATQE